MIVYCGVFGYSINESKKIIFIYIDMLYIFINS